MNRGGYERRIRQAHRWVGLGALGFLLLSVTTGLLWADSKFLYWDDHYKEKVRPLAGPPVEAAALPLDRMFALAKEAVGGHAVVEQASLRADFGRLFYDVKLGGEGVSTTVLLDAITGERLSPITQELVESGIHDRYLPLAKGIIEGIVNELRAQPEPRCRRPVKHYQRLLPPVLLVAVDIDQFRNVSQLGFDDRSPGIEFRQVYALQGVLILRAACPAADA